MGYFVGIPLGGAAEKDCRVRFGKNMTFQVETRAPHLPAEWALQSGVQLTWPHADTDWAYMLEEVQQCFIAIASEIAKRELLLIVTPEPEEVSCSWQELRGLSISGRKVGQCLRALHLSPCCRSFS